MKLQYLEKGVSMPDFFMYPRFLSDLPELSDTARLVYMYLLDRARISLKNTGWSDEQGRVFLNYTSESLAKDMRKSRSTVMESLAQLQKENLIDRKYMGACRPCRIYVRVPLSDFRTVAVRKSGRPVSGKLYTRNNNRDLNHYEYNKGESL